MKKFAVIISVMIALIGAVAEARPENLKKPDAIGIAEQAIVPSQNLFIILTGDGGWWGDLEAKIGLDLARRGYAVVGIDTNIWFRRIRGADEWAAFLGQIIDRYQQETKANRVFLLGWSYGANVLPIGFNRLSTDQQQKISAMVMLAPENFARLQVTLAGRMGLVAGDINLDPEMARMPGDRLFCVDGEGEEANSACILAGAVKTTRLMAPGGHDFDHQDAEMTVRILMMLKPFIAE